MIQNVVSKTCKTLSLIEYDEGFNSLDNEIYIKYIRLVILNFCRIFSDPNSDLYKLITCDNLNNIHDFVQEISTDNKKTILDIFFDKDAEKHMMDCKMKSDLSKKVEDNEDDEMQGGDDLPTTKKPVELKDGWLEKENLQGKKYWYNENTRESTDIQPEETKDEPEEDIEEDTKDEPEEDIEEDTKDEPEEDIEEDTKDEPKKDTKNKPKNELDILKDLDKSVLNKSDMSKQFLQSMTGLEKNEKGSKEVALEILNVLFNSKILDIIKKDKAIIALLSTFINNLYKQTRKYTNKDIVKNMQFCLEPFSKIAYTRHISDKLKIHDEYYKYILNMIENESHLHLMPLLLNHIEKYFIEIDNMIEVDMGLKENVITTLKEKIEIVHKDNEDNQRKVIVTFIDDMDKISKLDQKLIYILLPYDNIQGGKKTRSKQRKHRKPRKLTKRRKSG